MLVRDKRGHTVYMEPKLHAELRQYADAEGRSLCRTLERAVKEWWDSHKKKQHEEVLRELS